MDKAPLLCRIKSNIIRKSPSAIMAGCNFGIFPSGKCIDCPEYDAWWKEFEWSILKMDEKAWAVINAIIQRGNDAVVRKKGNGYIVLEDKRTIQYQSSN